MKTFHKNSFAYKKRRWIVVFLGILSVLHFIVILFLAKESQLIRESWFWIIFIISYIITEIKDGFSIVRLDGVIVQSVDFVISLLYLLEVFFTNQVFIIASFESVIFILGLLVIYKRNYKTRLFSKSKSKDSQKNRKKK